ncbi:MAG: rubrerythrin-like domain-containing protein [Halalkalicoccus sp.]|nr:rubrerythrin-like domain-containing protein [Halalkalicoccus sp.]
MSNHDPYSPTESYYECVECQHRTTSAKHPGICPECDGVLCNLAVARE